MSDLKSRFISFVGTAIWCFASLGSADDGTDFFETKIRPVLVENCYGCHSSKAQQKGKLKGELLLDTQMGIRKGGESGPAIVPKNVGASLLLAAIRHESFEMPPKGKLPDRVIADFVKWVEMGAPDPRDGTSVIKKDEIDIEAGRRFRSFRAFEPTPPPSVSHDWPRTDIDRFVLAALEQNALQPVDDADSTTLVRRLYFNLIGLPPTPQEVDTFIKSAIANRQVAVESLVDQLLDSPHFGERWARHWLDVARYAENNGAPKQNALWPDALKYRDYVIDAFNKDKPFDQFVLEQIAGDLLPAVSDQQAQQQVVATGLLALGMKPDAGTRMEVIAEQTDVIGRGFLGIAIGCARCHDHKFDPVPTRDFYALAGILFNSVPKDQNSHVSRSRHLAKLEKSDIKKYQDYIRGLSTHNGAINKSRARIAELLGKKGLQFDPLQSIEENVNQLEGNERQKAQQAAADIEKAEASLNKLRSEGIPDVALAIAVEETGFKRKFVNTRIQIRGNEDNLGDEVPRGALQVLTAEPLQVGEDESGRLQFGQLVSTHPLTYPITRREALKTSACGFGSLALAALCNDASAKESQSPLDAKQPHFEPKVKRVIFMFMEGGPSHVDTFDYKPALAKHDGKTPPYDQPRAGSTGHKDSVMQPSPFKFSQHGESGLWISDRFPKLAKHADDLCLINSMHHETGIHEPGCVMMHTGEFRFARPSMGSWITYGLGSESNDLPAYMVVNPRDRNESNGCFSSAFLPAVYDATIMRNVGGRGEGPPPIRNVRNPLWGSEQQRRQLDFIQAMNRDLQQRRESDSNIDAVIESYERAFRMQTAVPRMLDFSRETQTTLQSYGINTKGQGGPFAIQCLLARRLAEEGVRFIEISQGGWDHHNSLLKNMTGSSRNVDQPIAALIGDLKQRGLWKDTLLVWGGEFGRTPAIEDMKDKEFGRDHNGAGFTYWLAGGGVKGGFRYGATDELGWFASENKVHVHDLHATILHLLGLDHKKLSFRYGGRDYTLTDVDGEVVREILA